MKHLSVAILVVTGAAWAAAAPAQTMYRCGKSYQDRPCAAGQPGKAMGSAVSSAPPAQAAGAVPPECVQKGKDSLKIVWAREGGASQERLLHEATSEAQRRLIRDVYPRGGAASTVQKAVEADCAAAMAKAEQDAAVALAAALKAQREGTLPPGQPAYVAPAAPDPAVEERRKAELAAAKADEAKRYCASLNSQMEQVRSLERRGGSVRTMEQLADRRRDLQKQFSDGGC